MNPGGRGSIVQLDKAKPRSRCRYWQLRVCVGRNPATGRYQCRTRRFHGSYREAERALDDFRTEVKGLAYTDGSDPPFSAAAAAWIEHKRTEVAASSIGTLTASMEVIARALNDPPLSKVDASAVTAMEAAMVADGRRPSYVRTLHARLRSMTAWCAAQGWCQPAALDEVKPPKGSSAPRRALTRAQMAALLDNLDTADEHHLAVLLVATMGLRRAEVCALTFGCVDWDARTLTLPRSKTDAGLRTLPIPERAYTALCQQSQRLALVLTPDTPICTDELCEPMTPQALGDWWRRHRAALGVDGWKLHELRHSFVSLLSESGASVKAMQELAGHTSASTTIGIYAHATMDEKRAAVERAYHG